MAPFVRSTRKALRLGSMRLASAAVALSMASRLAACCSDSTGYNTSCRSVDAAAGLDADVSSLIPEELVLLQVELRVASDVNHTEDSAAAKLQTDHASGGLSQKAERISAVREVRAAVAAAPRGSSLMQQNATLSTFVTQVSEEAATLWSTEASVAKTFSLSGLSAKAALGMWSPFSVVLLGALAVLSLLLAMWLFSRAAHSGGAGVKEEKLPDADPRQMSGRRLYARQAVGPASALVASLQDEPAGPMGPGARIGMPPTARLPPPGVVKSSATLPPICESLVMPHSEARFVIKAKDLLRPGVENIDINGTTGRTLLRALLWQSEDGRRCLGIASVNCEDDPRVIVLAPRQDDLDQQAFELRGKNDFFYGTAESTASGCVLKHKDQRVMTLEDGDPAELKMTAYAIDRSPLAAAGRSYCFLHSGQQKNEDNWRITVKPGVDAVLIIACMLSRLLLRPAAPTAS